jgi:hypothetical protein
MHVHRTSPARHYHADDTDESKFSAGMMDGARKWFLREAT